MSELYRRQKEKFDSDNYRKRVQITQQFINNEQKGKSDKMITNEKLDELWNKAIDKYDPCCNNRYNLADIKRVISIFSRLVEKESIDKCRWEYIGADWYESQCGKEYDIDFEDNEMKYCPNCRNKIKLIQNAETNYTYSSS